MQQAIQEQVLRAAKAVEDQLDGELHRLENLDEDDLERARQRRIAELKRWVGPRRAAAAQPRHRKSHQRQAAANSLPRNPPPP